MKPNNSTNDNFIYSPFLFLFEFLLSSSFDFNRLLCFSFLLKLQDVIERKAFKIQKAIYFNGDKQLEYPHRPNQIKMLREKQVLCTLELFTVDGTRKLMPPGQTVSITDMLFNYRTFVQMAKDIASIYCHAL